MALAVVVIVLMQLVLVLNAGLFRVELLVIEISSLSRIWYAKAYLSLFYCCQEISWALILVHFRAFWLGLMLNLVMKCLFVWLGISFSSSSVVVVSSWVIASLIACIWLAIFMNNMVLQKYCSGTFLVSVLW